MLFALKAQYRFFFAYFLFFQKESRCSLTIEYLGSVMYRWWSFVMKLESSYATEAKILRPKKRMLLFHFMTDKGFYTPCNDLYFIHETTAYSVGSRAGRYLG